MGVTGWEDLSGYRLDDAELTELLAAQTECTFIWSAADGHPVGAVVNFVFRRGSFWVTATRRRPRVGAVERDPRVSISISSHGSPVAARRSVSVRGRAVVHTDEPTLTWFAAELAAAVRPDDPAKSAEFARLLLSQQRVVIELVPTRTTGFDGAKMWAAAPSAAPPSKT